MTTEPADSKAPYVDPDLLSSLTDLLRRGSQHIESEIRGSSMGDSLPDGARIRIRCGPPGREPGSVLAFVTTRTIVAHRLVGWGVGRRASAYAITRGDGSALPDPPVDAARILGEVVAWGARSGWRPVPPPRRSSRATRLLERLMLAGLEVHVVVPRAIHALVFYGSQAARRLAGGHRAGDETGARR